MRGCLERNYCTLESSTSLSSSRSTLLPTRMKGNFYGYLGAPWLRNSVIQDSMLSKDCVDEWILVYWWCRRLRRSSLLHDRRLLLNCGTFIDQLCPRSDCGYGYFEVDDFTIDDHFFLHEISAHCCLVWLQKLLVHVAEWRKGYALSRDVFPTLCQEIITRNRPEWWP